MEGGDGGQSFNFLDQNVDVVLGYSYPWYGFGILYTNDTKKFEKAEKARYVSILDHKLGVDATITSLHKLSNNMRTINFSFANGIECMPSLRHLSFYGCHRLECFNEGIQRLTALRHLSFYECKSLISLPQGMKHLTALRHLSFLFCSSLISLPQGQQRLGQEGQIQFSLDVLGRLFSQKRMFLVLKIATAYQFSHNMQHRKSQPSLVFSLLLYCFNNIVVCI
ncbi:hypothetical protein CMV_027085 [Castanea mollissima]|uniref:Uncharacterized protein n=1 Tax=Castanea mollissima TaxID=60419 RepID=A0A8J4V9R5_9ROSI|nr:hypothetical protein CMV_027085 [Castanea mollissima]